MKQQKDRLHIHVRPDLAPPWRTSETWQEANWSVADHMMSYGSDLGSFKGLFRDIKERMNTIFSMLDELCDNTCPWCPDPCCLSASVWFDFRDLLFLHASGNPIPPSQPKQDLKATCRYLGHRGCSIPRISRPWICTRYLCDSQLACLRKKDQETQDVFNQAIQTVNKKRTAIEDVFIRVVAF